MNWLSEIGAFPNRATLCQKVPFQRRYMRAIHCRAGTPHRIGIEARVGGQQNDCRRGIENTTNEHDDRTARDLRVRLIHRKSASVSGPGRQNDADSQEPSAVSLGSTLAVWETIEIRETKGTRAMKLSRSNCLGRSHARRLSVPNRNLDLCLSRLPSGRTRRREITSRAELPRRGSLAGRSAGRF